MDEVIQRAIDSINQLLESLPPWRLYKKKTRLINTCSLLNRLVESDLPNNDWTRLFCRQLKRLMDYNESLSAEFWIKLQDDILYILEKSNGEQGMGSVSNRFLTRMNFEQKLEQRELKFQQLIGERKSLSELFNEHKEFFEAYFQKCIDFHSKVQVQGLIENIDGLLCRIYGLTKISLTLESRQLLNEKLKCIEMPIDCSNRSLNSLDSQFFTNDKSSQRVNSNPNTFLPSQQINMNMSDNRQIIEDVLGCNRWIVILGDPGSAKTTLLRWIACLFAEAAHRSQENVDLEGHYRLPVRIPILIRIGELAAWVNQHQTKTLIDYIGEHTWFSQRYCDDKGGSVLKELIYHGHALILLDGLDEISEIGRRGEIVDLVEKFVDEYIRAPAFISAFDDTTVFAYQNVIETRPPSKSGGNQIVISSRIVGYQFHPLIGPSIQHYTFLLMDHQEANEFVKKWMRQVDKSVCDVLLTEGIEFGRETVKTSSKKILNVVEAIFENSSKLLKSNPSLLSLICTFISQSSTQFHLKSRVEVYNHAVQAALRAWKSQESSVSENVLNNFLIDLATYLHLQSSSGLIDAFDMEHLCCLTLKQQDVSNNRTTLHKYANKIISLLESNIGIVTERGLQVFGFLHLSFQEYFVAQIFVRGSDIEEVAKRILSFTINSRFRESLLLAFGWISWKWPFDKYDQFCNFLITGTEDQSILFGTLLLFDAINDMHRLPSNWIIYIALNNLLNYPSNTIRSTYLISNSSKLPKDIIIEWMQLHLQDDKYLRKFCQSFPMAKETLFDKTEDVRKLIPSVVYEQLWSFHNRNSSIEFLMDQILRRTLVSDDISDQIFNKDLSLYFLSHNICPSSIHPLIASAIIAVCGGISRKDERDIMEIHFSPKQMHRESSIFAPIIEYFDNNDESHLTKMQTLIEQYENVLQQSLPSDTSVDVIDTFIALICLQGLSQPLIYQKYDGYQALSLALDRLRRTWFYFKQSCNPFQGNCSMVSEIESITNVFFSQSNQSEEERTSFSVACETAWKKLGMWNALERSNIDICYNNKVSRYFQCQPEFTHIVSDEKLDRIINDIYSLQMLQMDLFFLITFLPQPLQQLYYYTTISPTNNADSLPLVVFLIQCLTYFEHIHEGNLNPYLTISMLQSLFKEYMLENYALALFWKNYHGNEFTVNDHGEFPKEKTDRKELYKAMKDRKLLDPSLINRPKDWEIFISQECQRIEKLKATLQNEEKDVRLFAASISLAQLFQAKYRSRQYPAIKVISLTSTQSKEIYLAITNILDPALRIIAFSIILGMKDPLIFDEEQRHQLQWEMISLLQSWLPYLSLLTSTFLFIQCHTARHMCPEPFQHMASIMGNKLNETSTDKQGQEQEAAYIALRYLNNSDLSHYLSEFAKQKENLSDALQFNSTTFYRHFTNTTSFDSSNSILLSMMYLVELAFDAQILNMYNITTQKNKIASFTILKQLWHDSLKDEKIMAYPVALWITNYLHMSNVQEIHQIIHDVSCCTRIETKALPVMEKWLDYRTNKDFRFFAHYAALQLVVEGSSMPSLIDIIEEMFLFDLNFCLKSTVECLFTSVCVNLTILHQLLVRLHRNIRYSSNISVWIDRRETFELILNLELERITTSVRQTPHISTKSILLIIEGCSEDLQIYLTEHLREFFNTYNEGEDTIKEEYVAVVIKWIIENLIGSELIQNPSIELYNYIFVLLHDQRFPRAQKAIVNALNSVLFREHIQKENVFLQDDAIIEFERVICSWKTYSEDVVAVCLLVYGNCLLKLYSFHISRNVSDEMKNILSNLFDTSSSEIISIRANFCLIFCQYSNKMCRKLSNWCKGESNMTCERRYKILLQQTLYKVNKWSSIEDENENESIPVKDKLKVYHASMNEIVEHIEKYFAELIDTFITDLYNHLCNNNTNINISDLVCNYIEIAQRVSETKPKEFCNAIQKSSFGEENLKRKLCLCCTNNSIDIAILIYLYLVFGRVTVEFIDMLERIDDDKFYGSFDLSRLKLVSDSVAMEKLLGLVNLTTSYDKLSVLLHILGCLAKVDAVSLLEVHQGVSLINHIPYDNSKGWDRRENLIFDLLLGFSCFTEGWSPSSENRIFTVTDIDEEFEIGIQRTNTNFPLSMRRNLFLQ